MVSAKTVLNTQDPILQVKNVKLLIVEEVKF